MLFLKECSYVLYVLRYLVLGLPRAQLIKSPLDLHKRFRWLEHIYRNDRVSKPSRTPPGSLEWNEVHMVEVEVEDA